MSEIFDLERDLENERRHADAMAETLRTAHRYLPEHERHVIAVHGSQVTIGMVIEGQLALHDLKRLREDDRIRPPRAI